MLTSSISRTLQEQTFLIKVATCNYFGQIPPLKHTDMLYFKADGKSRGKLGVGPPGKSETICRQL